MTSQLDYIPSGTAAEEVLQSHYHYPTSQLKVVYSFAEKISSLIEWHPGQVSFDREERTKGGSQHRVLSMAVK